MSSNRQSIKRILIPIIVIFAFSACKKRIQVNAVVVEHNVTADKIGDRTYSTVVKTEDGYVEELVGLKYYTVPVGKKITITVWR